MAIITSKKLEKECPGRWRLSALGQISKHPTKTTEWVVNAYFHQLKPNSGKPIFSNTALENKNGKPIVRPVKLSLDWMAALEIGSVWTDGQREDENDWSLVGDTETLFLSSDQTEKIEFEPYVSSSQSGKPSYLISGKYYRFEGALDGKLCRFVRTKDKVEFLVPEFVLFWFYYGSSGFWNQSLVNGRLSEDPDQLYNRNHTYYDKEHETAYVGVRKQLTNFDAIVLAKIIGCEKARQGAVSLRKKIQIKSYSPHQDTDIGFCFPFDGETKLRMLGKRVKCHDGTWRFLGLRILNCSGAFPFKRLEIRRDNPGSNRESFPGEDREKSGQQSVKAIEIDDSPEIDVSIEEDQEAQKLLNKFVDSKMNAVFEAYNDIVIDTKHAQEDHLTDSKGYITALPIEVEGNAIGEGAFGDSTFRPSTADEFVGTVELGTDKSLAVFCDGVKKLEELNDISLKVTFKKLGERYIKRNNLDLNFICLEKSKKNRSFRFTNHERSERRTCVLVELKYLNNFVYILKIQPGGNQLFAINMFSKNDFGSLNNDQLINLLKHISFEARRSNWFKGYRLTSIRHSMTDAESYKKRFLEKVKLHLLNLPYSE
ncbi:hypothetical protein GUA87_02950 [Sneathiella sp. P13V-1]|uniref:hypothetical protein n=1 Tax=Sneathiella sp. P13V-1 TaxID=2697366 RepID=UPI00187B2419|nr:hypothetical protein [Sneathiella sp. P13V-1]MBE7635784.1 hypothetical protein [Sneathiella sp. P13V-1]